MSRRLFAIAILLMLGLSVPVIAHQDRPTHQVTDARGRSFDVVLPITVDTIPARSTTTTTEATTTTTEPTTTTETTTTTSTTTTTVPPTTSTAQRGVTPADVFHIILRGGDPPEHWWTAPYLRDLSLAGFPAGWGWTDGDRVGYRCVYMFLFRNHDPADIVGRVTFTRPFGPAEGYAFVNDKYMDEGVRFYDGTLSTTGASQLNDCPEPDTDYDSYDGPNERPEVYFTADDEVIEDRSYTHTTSDAIDSGRLVFEDEARIDEPFTTTGHLGIDPHTVHQRATIIAHYNGATGLVVYYDVLVPEVKLTDTLP